MLVTNDKNLYQKLYFTEIYVSTIKKGLNIMILVIILVHKYPSRRRTCSNGKYKKTIKMKLNIAKMYINEFKDKIFNFVKNKPWAFNTYWMFGIVIKRLKNYCKVY